MGAPAPSAPRSSHILGQDTNSAVPAASVAPSGWGSCHNTHRQIMA